ncbi:MAG: outer membrane beta-barrel protein [Legionellales bacterium]|nr:outer membrane beta-barrel protein [Legionellales bacterium]
MYKIITLLTYGLLSLVCVDAYASESSFNGLYLGADAGVGLGYFSESGDSSLNIDERPNIHIPIDAPIDSNASNLSGFLGGHLGVGHVFNRFYLGLEANGDFGEVDTTNYAPPTNATGDLTTNIKEDASIKNPYGITLRPGYLLTPSLLLYAQLGVEKAQINTNTLTTFENVPTQSDNVYTIQSGSNGSQLGYRAGIGIEDHPSEHLSVRVEYLFTDFGSVSSENEIPVTGHLILPTSAMNQSANFTTYFHSVLLGVSYYV